MGSKLIDVSDVPDASGDAPAPHRRVAWVVVLLAGWAFSYSFGWQKGWVHGVAESDGRFRLLNETVRGLQGKRIDFNVGSPSERADATSDADAGLAAGGTSVVDGSGL